MKHSILRKKRNSEIIPVKIVSVYVIVSGLWIFFSDKLVGMMIQDREMMTRLSTMKGFLFIIVTATLLYLLIRRATNIISRSEAEFRRFIEKSPVPTALSDSDSKIIYLNEKFSDLFGYALSDLPTLDAWWVKAYPDEAYRAAVVNAWEEVTREAEKAKRETRPMECDVRCLDTTSVCTVLISATMIGDKMLVTFNDLTDHKKAELQLQKLKNHLANIIDSMPSVLVGINKNLFVTEWNRQAESFTGISEETARGRLAGELLPEFKDSIETLQKKVAEGNPASIRKLALQKNGKRHYYDIIIYPLAPEFEAGAVIRIEDLTEAVQLQDMMIQTEKMVSIGGLAAGMAHEINNPLGIISLAAHDIENRISPDHAPNQTVASELGLDLNAVKTYFERRKIAKFLEAIRIATDRAAHIVSNVLQFSRKSQASKQEFKLPELIEHSLSLASNDYDLRKHYDFRNIEVVKDFDEKLPCVSGVMIELEQVFLNLIKNAAHALSSSPIEKKPRLTLRTRLDGNYALVEVEDNGCGMSDEIRQRIFEPFFTTKEPGKGTGLGLSVCYSIITQNHGGLISVQSNPGHGTIFSVRLPMSTDGVPK